jgi:hypothetical protein
VGSMSNPDEALEAAAAAVSDALAVTTAATAGTALVKGVDNAQETKARLGGAYSEIAKVRNTAKSAIEVAKAAIEEKKQELMRAERDLAAQLVPLQKELDRLADGIGAVNLYLGTDEELEELRGGESAPADEPISIRQLVLAMDEETAILDRDNVGLDFKDRDVFLKWLLESEEHMQQVLPERKGVVTFMARSTPLDYTGEPISNAAINKNNFHTHWLIRNGDRVYALTTPFAVGTLLIPTRREFTALFAGLEPGSKKWIEAEEARDGLARHYAKVAMILQGLVDRTAVFHPLPEGGVSLLNDRDYDNGKVVLIEDDEKAITSGRQPFLEWQRERIQQLEVGQRVIGWFSGGRGEDSYTYPRFANSPEANVPYTITRQDAGNWYFSYPRTDEVEKFDRWGRHRGWGPAETSASYRIPKSDYHPTFIPVDSVTIEEMREYLTARTERKEYATLFPALQAAVAFKAQEDEAEAPFRQLLAQRVGGDEAARELVSWYKHSTKWYRPLVGDGEAERKASKAILAEFDRRSKPIAEGVVDSILAQYTSPVLVVARRTNDFVVVQRAERIYGENSVPQDIFVHLDFFTLTGKRIIGQRREWQTLTKAQVSKWTILRAGSVWDAWRLNVLPGLHLPDHEITRLLDELKEWATDEGRGRVSVVKYHETEGNEFLRGTMPKVIIYFESVLKEDGLTLEQPEVEKYIEVKNGVGSFDPKHRDRWSKSSTQWKIERAAKIVDGNWKGFPDERAPLVPVSPHTVNYSNEYPKSVVWTDPAVLKDDFILAGTWVDNRARKDKRDAKINNVRATLEQAWREYEVETRRARFIADYGDPELWEDHSKAQKPTAQPFDFATADKFARAVIAADLDISGLTLESALNALDAPIPGFPEEALQIQFPAAQPVGEDDE